MSSETLSENKLATISSLKASNDVDLVRSYLRDIGRVPLLSHEQEITLGRQVQEYMQVERAELEIIDLTGDKPSIEELSNKLDLSTSVIKKRLRAGQRAKERMVAANLRLVVSVAKKYTKRNMELLDLIQEGTIGLVRGVEKFDPARGYKFSTYAYWWIRQGINRALSTQSRTIRIPVNINEKLTKLRSAKSKLMQLKGIPPNSEELAEEMKITKEEIDELLSCELRSITDSLQGTVKSKSDPSELVDILPSDQTPPMELAELAERTASAWKLLEKANLSEKERKIVSLRFGLDGSNEWRTLAEVARHMSCSREYCRQVVQRALRKLRKAGIQNGLVDSIS